MARILDNGGDYGGGTSGGTSGGSSSSGSSAPMGAAGVGTAARPGQTNVIGLRVKVAVADTPVRCNPERVLPGERVYISPLFGNTKVVRVAISPANCLFGPYDEVAPTDTEREFPVDNTGYIWVMQPTGAFVLSEGIAVKPRRSV